ncbi:hypothetical protein O0L34_g17702 [Tuta absoluta]|nr:hypothetical protein O0L34_g17702 [Tuta absoluta]
MQRLLDFLQDNANLEHIVDKILHRQNKKSSDLNKRWVDKIVSHRQKTPEIDRALGLSFKPLDRLHKTKKIQLENVRDKPRQESQQDELKELRSTLNEKGIRPSLPPIHVYDKNAAKLIRNLREVDAFVEQHALPSVKKEMFKKIDDFAENMGPKLGILHRDILSLINHQFLQEKSVIKLLREESPKIEDIIIDENDVPGELFQTRD